MASDGATNNGAGSLRFGLEPGGAEIACRPEIAIVAGYTGRDRHAVLEHIAELEGLGIAPPEAVPTFYAVSPQLVTQAGSLVVTEAATSGEAEVGLVVDRGVVFVTVCSDHTDRAAERFDVALSKRVCPKVLGTSAWRLEDVIGRWDSLQLRSWIGEECDRPYQDGALGALLGPRELLGAIPWRSEPACFVLLCGTVATIAGIQSSPRFRAELSDPVSGRRLELEYAVEALDVFRPASEDDSSLEPAGLAP
jgi:Protein of unknown function (DUF2848)